MENPVSSLSVCPNNLSAPQRIKTKKIILTRALFIAVSPLCDIERLKKNERECAYFPSLYSQG
jgi:hypothetical protein